MDKDAFAENFGKKIKKLRKSKGLSQEQLAEHINKTVDTISSIERGLSSPRLDTALDLAQVFGVPVHELFHVNELANTDRVKADLLDEINALLKQQPSDLIDTVLEQAKQLVDLKEKLTQKKS